MLRFFGSDSGVNAFVRPLSSSSVLLSAPKRSISMEATSGDARRGRTNGSPLVRHSSGASLRAGRLRDANEPAGNRNPERWRANSIREASMTMRNQRLGPYVERFGGRRGRRGHGGERRAGPGESSLKGSMRTASDAHAKQGTRSAQRGSMARELLPESDIGIC